MIRKKIGKINSIIKITENMKKLEDKVFDVTLDQPFRLPSKTFGQKAADNVAKWAGSWFFIIFLGILLIIWMSVNTLWIIFGKVWDPYPFILLNFILSTLAAVQAPIILMSQNREAQKDRARAQYDYAVNKKAEKEIRELRVQLNRIENKIIKK